MRITDIVSGLTRVQSLDPEDDDIAGLVLQATPTGGVLVRWDGGADVWTTAGDLCREGSPRGPSQCDEACTLDAGHDGDHDPKVLGDQPALDRPRY